MKLWLPTFILIAVVLAAYPFLFREDQPGQLTGLPWQIERLEDGNIRVFGLVPGRSTLQQAVDVLGTDYELAVMAPNRNETGSLELYYGRYRAGLLGGKMVLATATDPGAIERWVARAIESETLETGARKHTLDEQDVVTAMRETVDSITFIPAVNLDDEIIRERFGIPEDVITKTAGSTHYLYPDKGLDITLNDEGREVLQYVAPSAFERLKTPLGE